MVIFAVVFAGRMLMARTYRPVARVLQLGAVRIVAVGAADVFVKHLAFEERSVFIDFVQNLAIGVIGRWRQHFVRKIVVVVAAGGVARRRTRRREWHGAQA